LKGRTYREHMLKEVGHLLDASRVHFLGRVPYETYRKVLQVSTAHVYLTYPFVLSWSILEAMACECVVIGSKTPPVGEVIEHGKNGLLVDFFDPQALCGAIELACEDRERLGAIRSAARATVSRGYDLRSVCLPRQAFMLDASSGGNPFLA
jgi:glycosyltransferase involved in cell wall biosynthesis